MKKFNFAAIIIIGLLFNLLPAGAFAAESNEETPDISMTFDYDEFISSSDETTTAITTTTTAVTTATTTTLEETPEINSTTVVLPTTAATETTTAGHNDSVPTDPPPPSSPQPSLTTTTHLQNSTTNTTALTTNTSATNSTCREPSINIDTNKFMIFCSLSLTKDKKNLLMTVKTQAKRVVDSIGFSDITLSKFDQNKQLILETSLDDMLNNNAAIFSEDIPIQVEGGYFYKISGYHTVTVSGCVKTLFNQSQLIFAEEISQPDTTTQANSAINNYTATTTAADTDVSEKPPVTTKNNISQIHRHPAPQPSSSDPFPGNAVSPINKPASSTIFKSQPDRLNSVNSSDSAVKTTARQDSTKNSAATLSPSVSSPDTGDSGAALGGFILSLLFASVLFVRKIETE